jgi:ABC-type uncharacterized transport system substrate-binding protein
VITRRGLIVGGLSLLSAQTKAQAASDQPIVGSLFISRPGRSYVWERMVAHMQTLGYVDGETIRYVPRFTQDPAQLPSLASEIAALSPRAVYANGDEPARAAAAQWSRVPIVAMTDDHVGAGLTDSLSHPSRNVTGVSRLESELDTKRLGLLHELVPAVTLVLVLRDPQTTWLSRAAALEEAAAHSGIGLFVRDIRGGSDVDDAIAAGEAAGAGAVLVLGSPLLTSTDVESRIRRAAMARHLPTMVQIARQVAYGNLAGYGIDEEATILRLAQILDRVLKGTRPKDIPIEQPTKFEFSINLQVARELRLTVPQSLLQRADEVIE